MKKDGAEYEELMRAVPVIVREWLEQLQSTVDAQTDLIAYLQLERQMRQEITRNQFYDSIQKWAARQDSRDSNDAHAQLAAAVVRSFDVQQAQLDRMLQTHAHTLRQQRGDD